MLDVHPPEHTPHTWREFFIHIATIVLGLLIAIGLEQTVEAIHHHHQRHQLVEDLRQEAEQDEATNRHCVDQIVEVMGWQLAVMDVLQNARPQRGTIQATLPAHAEFVRPYLSLPSVWTIAKSNGQAALLPEIQAKLYERVQTNAGLVNTAFDQNTDSETAVRKQEVRLKLRLKPGTTITLPVSEVAPLLEALAGMVTTQRLEAERAASLIGFEEGVAHGVTSQKELTAYRTKEDDALRSRWQAANEPF